MVVGDLQRIFLILDSMFVYTCGQKVTTRTEAHLSFLGGRKPQDFVRDLLPCSPLVILYMKDHFSSSFLLDVVEDKLYVRRLENMSSAFGADSYPTHLDQAVKSTKHLCYHLRGFCPIGRSNSCRSVSFSLACHSSF